MGIDVGTTGCKVVVFNPEEKIIRHSYQEYGIDVPQAGWAEQDPQVWWEATKRCIKKILIKIKPEDIEAVGLCGQMHTHVLLDKTCKPLRPAIT